ncbi:hypothetical protein H0H93_000158 [Arthromyces matolae]|nr:hypothetical protein H0H93_000158 [Arthromyces matolae]
MAGYETALRHCSADKMDSWKFVGALYQILVVIDPPVRLDGLPFRSSYFDFVRVVNIGLGVPEDEEIARVMKPGGVIEVIEEDPIFPCARSPSPRANLRLGNSSTTLVDRAPSIIIPPSTTRLASRSRATIWSDPSTVTLHERYDLNSPTSPYDTSSPTTPLSAHPFAPSNILPLSTSYLHNPIRDHLPGTHHRKASISLVETDNSSDLRDHSRLKAAWNAMLASRFIAENTLSVLPFYMSSSFVDVVNMPPLKVILPPNSEVTPSGSRSERSSSESFLSSSSTALGHSHSTSSLTTASNSSMRTFTAAPSTLSRTSSGESIDSYSTECAQMHLATTVHTVTGCKEAIWHEYKKLYDINVAKVVSPDAYAPSGHAASYVQGNVKSSIRESFEDEWDAWYNDMTDRIGMRALMSQLNWPEPPGQRPDWHVWRAKVPAEDRSPFNSSIPAIPDLCRSIRAFIGWKPL